MKALYIATAYPRHPQDVITPWLGETIRRLGSAGVTVEVLAPSYRGEPARPIDGVVVHRFRYAPARIEDLTHDQTAPDRLRERPAYLGLVPGYLAAGMAAAARIARRGDFDLVHVHWPIPHALFGMAARRAAGIPMVCSFHGVELTWTRRDWPVLLPLLRRLIHSADAVTANSTYTAGMIRRVYDRPVVRIPFGTTLDVESDGDVAPAGSAPGPLRLLFVGRLVERKGVAYLLDALASLPAGTARLDVVGDGPLRAELEGRAAGLGLGDRARFHGFVSAEALRARYRESDVFVLPAVVDAKGDTEGLGVVLVEALAYGRPAVASGVGGIVDVVRDGESGLLVPPADPPALAAAIRRLAGDRDLVRRLGRGGLELVRAEFAWPVIIDRLVRLYQDVVHGRDARGSQTGRRP